MLCYATVALEHFVPMYLFISMFSSLLQQFLEKNQYTQRILVMELVKAVLKNLLLDHFWLSNCYALIQ